MRVTIHHKIISVVDENYLPAYQKLRDILLVMGYGIKRYGSCINAVQSGMMGASDKMYLVTLGNKAVMKDIVHLFDSLDIKEFSDTQTQLNYLDTWYTSL